MGQVAASRLRRRARLTQSGGMSATVALMFFAQAATTCPAVAPQRLRGGANVLQAIATVEAGSFEPEAFTPAAVEEPVEQSDQNAESAGPEASQPAEQCEDMPAPIV